MATNHRQPKLLTVEEAALLLHRSVKTIRRMYGNGILTAYHRHGTKRIFLLRREVLESTRMIFEVKKASKA